MRTTQAEKFFGQAAADSGTNTIHSLAEWASRYPGEWVVSVSRQGSLIARPPVRPGPSTPDPGSDSPRIARRRPDAIIDHSLPEWALALILLAVSAAAGGIVGGWLLGFPLQ